MFLSLYFFCISKFVYVLILLLVSFPACLFVFQPVWISLYLSLFYGELVLVCKWILISWRKGIKSICDNMISYTRNIFYTGPEVQKSKEILIYCIVYTQLLKSKPVLKHAFGPIVIFSKYISNQFLAAKCSTKNHSVSLSVLR